MQGTFGHLNEKGMQEWGAVFPNGMVPILIQKYNAKLGAMGTKIVHSEVYLLDLGRLFEHQRIAILEKLAERFNAPALEIQKQLKNKGIPIRAELISAVSTDARLF